MGVEYSSPHDAKHPCSRLRSLMIQSAAPATGLRIFLVDQQRIQSPATTRLGCIVPAALPQIVVWVDDLITCSPLGMTIRKRQIGSLVVAVGGPLLSLSVVSGGR